MELQTHVFVAPWTNQDLDWRHDTVDRVVIQKVVLRTPEDTGEESISQQKES